MLIDHAWQRLNKYFPCKWLIATDICYLSTAFFTSISPNRAIIFLGLAAAIDRLAQPVFFYLLEPYQDVSLVPLIGQISRITLSALLSKVICGLFGVKLGLKQIYVLGALFLFSAYLTTQIYKRMKNHYLNGSSTYLSL